MVLPRIGSTVEYYSIEDIGAYTKVAIGKLGWADETKNLFTHKSNSQ